MPLTRYHFGQAVSAFYEMSTPAARACLPPHLEPLELRHSRGVFSVTAFDFTESEVGRYQEIVLAIIVPPLVQPGADLPKAAFYPFLVGTSTEASRLHAIERWRLPHYMADIAVDFDGVPGRVNVRVREGKKPILDFSVTDHSWSDVDHLYQSFMADDSGRYKADIHMKGAFTEHEEERGELEIHDHPMCEQIRNADIETYPFRELWMKDGVQTFEELETL